MPWASRCASWKWAEDEDVAEEMVVKEPFVKEAKKRGRPPLTEDQKEKNAATKAAKRAKKD